MEALSGLALKRPMFALSVSSFGLATPALRDVWAEYTRRQPDAIRGVRAIVARGFVAFPNGEKPADPLGETALEWLQLVLRGWRRLESIQASLTG